MIDRGSPEYGDTFQTVDLQGVLKKRYDGFPEEVAASADRRAKWMANNIHREKKLREMLELVKVALGPHVDNCGGDCRIDLDGHDCCHTCNEAEALAASYELIDKVYR